VIPVVSTGLSACCPREWPQWRCLLPVRSLHTDGFASTVSSCCLSMVTLTLSTVVVVLVACIIPMATMALSVMVVDGHNGTVDSCFLLVVSDGHHGTVRILLVRFLCGGYNSTSTPAVRTDGHVDTVGSCNSSSIVGGECRWPQWHCRLL
jgi:hypothetical protein